MTGYKQLIYLFCIFFFTKAQVYRIPIAACPKFYFGDFNGDGKKDLFRLAQDDLDHRVYGTAQMYQSASAQGDFDSAYFSTDFYMHASRANIYIGDFNGDGLDDVLRQEKAPWDNDYTSTAFIIFPDRLIRTYQVSLDEKFELHYDKANIYIGDFDGDGRDDILRQGKSQLGEHIEYAASVLFSDGGGVFRQFEIQEEFNMDGTVANLYIADFNGDGKDDILIQKKSNWNSKLNTTVFVLFSIGDGTFDRFLLPEEFRMNGEFTNLYIGDFNGDGKDDILRQEKGSWDDGTVNTASLLFSNGDGTFTSFTLPEKFEMDGDLTNLYIGDLSGDGKDDILRQEKGSWVDNHSDTVNILFSNGDSTFQKWGLDENLNLSGDLVDLYLVDLDGDGRADIVRHNKENGSGNYDSQNVVKGLYANEFGGYFDTVLYELGYLK